MRNIQFQLLAAVLMAAVVGVFGLATTAARAAAGQPLQITGRTVYPSGKAAIDVSVELSYIVLDGQDFKCTNQTTRPNARGEFHMTVPATLARQKYYTLVLCAASPSGVALQRAFVGLRTPPPHVTGLTLVLQPTTTVRVNLVDETGKPVPNVRISPMFLSQGNNYAQWDEGISSRWTAVTDVAGSAVLSGLPQGFKTSIRVDDGRYVQSASQFQLADAAATPDQTIHLVSAGSIACNVAYGPTGKPAPGVAVQVADAASGEGMGGGPTDAQGHFNFPRLAPGSYTLTTPFIDPVAGAWISMPQTVAVTAGPTPTVVNIALKPGATITGKVVDKLSGRPIPNLMLFGMSDAGTVTTYTDDRGQYRISVAPGAAHLDMEPTAGMPGVPPEDVQVAAGEIKTVDFKSTTPPQPILNLHGVVLGPGGNPAPGARVLAVREQQMEQDETAVADARGQFHFDNVPIMPDQRIYAMIGRLATKAGTPARSAAVGQPIELRLVAGALFTMHGQVVDDHGKPLASVPVMLFRWCAGMGSGINATMTDGAGHYTLVTDCADAQYQVEADPKSYTRADSDKFQAAPGNTADVPPLSARPTDSFIAGTVVDPAGKPVANARIEANDVTNLSTTSDAQGRFRLDGVPEGHTSIFIQAPYQRYAGIEEPTGISEVVITVATRDEQLKQGQAYDEKVKADTTNHGNGENAYVLFRAAEERAAASGKNVFLVFHASWCGSCFVLHRFLNDPQVKPIMDAHFVVQELDIWEHESDNKKAVAWENPGGTQIYKKYGGPNSVPFYVVVDSSGKKLGDAMLHGENLGMPSMPDGVDSFIKTLKAGAPDLTDSEVETLKTGIDRVNRYMQ